MQLTCGQRALDLATPAVMGILNVTPDSFSDGGRYFRLDDAVSQAERMIAEGARILDVGGESTRPGALPVDVGEECRRVLPVIEAIRSRFDVVISVDTRRPEVAQAALRAGADMINDVTALQAPGMLEVAAASHAGICLMHMRGEPRTMQENPEYRDVVIEVREFLRQRIDACARAGILRTRLAADPGIGFGKRLEHNLALLAHTQALCELGVPLLIGVSRKSMFKTLLGRDVEQRVAGGSAMACAVVLAGARIVRTHDVGVTVDAIRVATALRDAGYVASRRTRGRKAGS